jgi:TfoX/Sxy family transcriptional regulator of competence genes
MPSSKPAPAAGSAAVLFSAEQRSALLGDPSVTEKTMFGTTALCAGGNVFLFPWRDALVVKVPAARVEELIASGGAELFDPGHGRTSKTWAAAPASGSDCWPELALAAWAFAGT